MSGSKSPNLDFKLTATDVSASKTLSLLNKKLTGVDGTAGKLGKSLSQASDPTGLTKLSEGMSSLSRSSLDTFRSLDRMVPALGALTGAASIAGMGALVVRFAELGNSAENAGRRLGVPTNRLTALRGAARLAGASAEDLDGGLGALDEHLRGATFGRDAAAAQVFKQLGVSFATADGNARSAADALGDVAEAISNMKDRGAQVRTAQLLGLEALLPLLRQGKAGIQSLTAETVHLGAAVTPEMADRAAALHQSFEGLGLAIEGVENRLGDKWGQAIKPFVDGAASWIANNKDVADSYANIGTAILTLAALKPAAWVARMLGIPLAPLAAAASVVVQHSDTMEGATPDGFRPGWVPDNGPVGKKYTGATETFGQMYRRTMPSWLGGDGPRGIRNNNPLNLAYIPGQGAIGSDGRFGQYRTMADGVAADYRQILLDQDVHGLKTLRQLISDPTWGWAPAKDGNNTKDYIDDVSGNTGIDPDAPLNARDPDQASRLIWAMSKHENGQGIAGKDIQDGINQAMSGSVTVDVNLRNAPPGTTANVVTSGAASAPPPRIEIAMPGVH